MQKKSINLYFYINFCYAVVKDNLFHSFIAQPKYFYIIFYLVVFLFFILELSGSFFPK